MSVMIKSVPVRVFPAIACLLPVLMLAACSRDADISAPAPVSSPSAQAANPLRSSAVRVSEDMRKSADCNIEFIDKLGFEGGTPEVVRGDAVPVTGWIVDAKAGVAPSHAVIRLEAMDGSGAWEHPVGEWRERPDVVAGRGGAQGFLKSGFKESVPLSSLDAGPYRIYLAYSTPEGEIVCGIGRSFNLKE